MSAPSFPATIQSADEGACQDLSDDMADSTK